MRTNEEVHPDCEVEVNRRHVEEHRQIKKPKVEFLLDRKLNSKVTEEESLGKKKSSGQKQGSFIINKDILPIT